MTFVTNATRISTFYLHSCLFCWLLILDLSPAFAIDVDITTSASALLTSNSKRTAEDEIDEWIVSPELAAKVMHDGDRVGTEAEYRVIRRVFQENTYEDETVTTGSASLRTEVIPQLLDVRLTNHRTESTIRALASASPDNRQETTNTEISPTLKYPISKRHHLALQYKFNYRTSSRTDSDGDGRSAILRYSQNFSKNDTVEFETIDQKVSYDNVDVPDLRSNLARLRWQRELSRLQWSIDVGKKRTRRSLGRRDKNAVIGSLEFSGQLSENTALTLQINHDLLDQSQMLSFGTTDFGEQIIVDSDLNELFEGTDIYASYSGKIAAIDYSFGYRASKQAFVDDTVQRSSESSGLLATAAYSFNRFTTLTVRAQKIRQDFTDEGARLNRTAAGIMLSHTPRRNLSFTAGFLIDTSKSDSREFLDAEFDEWQMLLRVEQRFEL